MIAHSYSEDFFMVSMLSRILEESFFSMLKEGGKPRADSEPSLNILIQGCFRSA